MYAHLRRLRTAAQGQSHAVVVECRIEMQHQRRAFMFGQRLQFAVQGLVDFLSFQLYMLFCVLQLM